MISVQLNGLQELLSDFSAEATQQKLSVLNNISGINFKSAKEILHYHNQLLFLLSYAENAMVHSAAEKEMERITATISSSEKLKQQLTGSGIAGSAMEGAYSLTLTKWLLETYKEKVFFHSFDESGTHPKEIFKHVLPDAEFELLSDEKLSAEKWIQKAAGTKDKNRLLQWLVHSVYAIKASDSVKDQLFESLQLFIRVDSGDKTFSRSFGKVNVTKPFFHSDGIVKKFNERELIGKTLPSEKELKNDEKKIIVDASRVALALLIRETDPITYCEELNLKYFELERGLSIALFSIDSERRLPLESYIGFMMFKNGYPMSYGGAWLFGKRSLIGINIFEAFRGGESAIVFAQLCRCYHKAFGATYFEVEPYQFGKNNPEGIQSGAFWFYFRFGFRPVDNNLHRLSLEEQKKISSEKSYRSSYDTLKQFTKSNLFVHFDTSTQKPLNPSDMSRYVSKRIAKDFAGDRSKAQKWCVQQLRNKKIITGKENKAGLTKLCFFLAFCIDEGKLKAKEKLRLSKLVNEKGRSEFNYIELLKGFSFETHLSEDFKQFLL